MREVGVLFVCLGNICRSPTAEGIFRARVRDAGLGAQVRIDSAGTGGWHVGKAPDARAQAAARRHGYDLSALRARQCTAADFLAFDLILAMDRANLAVLQQLAPGSRRDRAGLVLSHARHATVDEVPDPYYGGEEGFEHVIALLEDAADGLLDHVRERLRD